MVSNLYPAPLRTTLTFHYDSRKGKWFGWICNEHGHTRLEDYDLKMLFEKASKFHSQSRSRDDKQRKTSSSD